MNTMQNMKTPGKIFAIVFFTLIAVPAYSSDVTYADDSYTTGDTLTAADLNAKFNEIKTDVNDNDTRVTTNATAAATNATGIATNATAAATNATGIATNATAAATNATGIATNATAAAVNATGIATNATAAATNATGIATNATAAATNATGIATNATAAATNATGIATNVTDIATNVTDIATNVTDIATNVTAIGTNATAITALETNACPSDMVAVGPLCVDKYEASVYDAATGGNKILSANIAAACTAAGSDCINTIYARSVASEVPAALISQYQAAVACASVGKRLPTTAEWQMAAAGTPTGTCNTTGGTAANTGSIPACISGAGAFDMIGNLWEWSADLNFDAAANGITTTDFSTSRALGDDYNGNGSDSTKDVWVLVGTGPGTGPDDAGNPIFGFRCVK